MSTRAMPVMGITWVWHRVTVLLTEIPYQEKCSKSKKASQNYYERRVLPPRIVRNAVYSFSTAIEVLVESGF